ncbi:unnamed protein product [Spirodela intermedia]|uniref:Uncharacterized protein n=1 Tax=Spirodela intermedia TaxID=51605 RepID=A0A7I8IJ73_SPIIN|nr:unnamed protein product [Spirodela intermedia]CAA6657014.1 unnamed protein product [Spirodela intermedia]
MKGMMLKPRTYIDCRKIKSKQENCKSRHHKKVLSSY